MSSITIPLSWPKPPLSQNDRNERTRGGSQKIKRALAEARMAVRAAQVQPLAGCVVTLHYRVADHRRRDADNLGSTLKVVQDALVKEQIIPRDDWVCVPSSGHTIHPPNGEGSALWIELTDVTPMQDVGA